MPSAFLRSKIDERAALTDLVEGILDRCATESRDPSTDEQARLEEYGNRMKALDGKIAELRTAEEANGRFLQVAERVEEAPERLERQQQRQPQPQAQQSYGERFIQSDAFKNYRGHGSSEAVEFEGFLEQRAAIDLATLNLPPVTWAGPQPYTTTSPLLNVLGRERVSGNSVDYITWGTGDPAAAVVAEGALKPEADITPTENSVSLKTYAHWKAITRQALEDYPRIRSIVEGKLRGGLLNALETAAAATLTAAGTGIPEATADSLMAGIRLGMADVQAAGYQANAVLLNPADFAALDIDAAASSNSGPQAFTSYWGMRPIAVGALAPGETYVGDFTNGLTWFDRGTTSVYMTDSHADYFIRNLLVILAEQRAAFAVTDPGAIAKVTAAPAELQTTAASSK